MGMERAARNRRETAREAEPPGLGRAPIRLSRPPASSRGRPLWMSRQFAAQAAGTQRLSGLEDFFPGIAFCPCVSSSTIL